MAGGSDRRVETCRRFRTCVSVGLSGRTCIGFTGQRLHYICDFIRFASCVVVGWAVFQDAWRGSTYVQLYTCIYLFVCVRPLLLDLSCASDWLRHSVSFIDCFRDGESICLHVMMTW
jgi:hypothetical protein